MRELQLLRLAVFSLIVLASAGTADAQSVIFVPNSGLNSEPVSLNRHEVQRIERFLARVYPVKAMKRAEHTSDRPLSRRVTYEVVSQGGTKFVLAGFTARWKNRVNMLGIYRMEEDGPNQVWRSHPWIATYGALSFESVRANGKSVVLFREGGDDEERFGFAGVFTFRNEDAGLVVKDLTPYQPRLVARTSFPFHALYGLGIGFEPVDEARGVVLKASIGRYERMDGGAIVPTMHWRFEHGRFAIERNVLPKGTMTHRTMQ